VRSYGAAPIRSLASRSTSAWARAWRLARRKSTSPAIPALRSTSKSATLSIATVFGSSSALDGYPNARNHAVALLSRCHRIYTTFRDLDWMVTSQTRSSVHPEIIQKTPTHFLGFRGEPRQGFHSSRQLVGGTGPALDLCQLFRDPHSAFGVTGR